MIRAAEPIHYPIFLFFLGVFVEQRIGWNTCPDRVSKPFLDVKKGNEKQILFEVLSQASVVC